MSNRTYSAKPADVKRAWHVIDVSDKVLGRAASQIATLLKGKHKPIYTPSIDTGDHVIVINAAKVKVTGNEGDGQALLPAPAGRLPGRPEDHQPRRTCVRGTRGHRHQRRPPHAAAQRARSRR